MFKWINDILKYLKIVVIWIYPGKRSRNVFEHMKDILYTWSNGRKACHWLIITRSVECKHDRWWILQGIFQVAYLAFAECFIFITWKCMHNRPFHIFVLSRECIKITWYHTKYTKFGRSGITHERLVFKLD